MKTKHKILLDIAKHLRKSNLKYQWLDTRLTYNYIIFDVETIYQYGNIVSYVNVFSGIHGINLYIFSNTFLKFQAKYNCLVNKKYNI